MKYLLQNDLYSDILIITKVRRGGFEMAVNNEKKLVIKQEWCKGCGICVNFCPKDVLALEHQKVTVKNPENCIKCGLCEMRCPDYAIYLEEKKNA
jgi:2-oxoglutarate ferredoxin oxidoreductase subunit delta